MDVWKRFKRAVAAWLERLRQQNVREFGGRGHRPNCCDLNRRQRAGPGRRRPGAARCRHGVLASVET